VTGGSGFVGSHFVPYLLDRGASRITILDRNEFTKRSPRLRSVITDIAEDIPWTPDGPVEVVYHLAAACREPGFTTAQYFRDNLQGTARVAEWAGRHDVRNIVFTSSMMVYGARDERVTEDSETRPDTDYGRSKLEAEQVLRSWTSAVPARRLRIVRPAVIFGKAERNNFTKLDGALRRRTFAFIGRDSTVKSCIYVKDFVRLLARGAGLGRGPLSALQRGLRSVSTTLRHRPFAFTERPR
jgi:nucleoside-diphosphate-sugar epimerase